MLGGEHTLLQTFSRMLACCLVSDGWCAGRRHNECTLPRGEYSETFTSVEKPTLTQIGSHAFKPRPPATVCPAVARHRRKISKIFFSSSIPFSLRIHVFKTLSVVSLEPLAGGISREVTQMTSNAILHLRYQRAGKYGTAEKRANWQPSFPCPVPQKKRTKSARYRCSEIYCTTIKAQHLNERTASLSGHRIARRAGGVPNPGSRCPYAATFRIGNLFMCVWLAVRQ